DTSGTRGANCSESLTVWADRSGKEVARSDFPWGPDRATISIAALGTYSTCLPGPLVNPEEVLPCVISVSKACWRERQGDQLGVGACTPPRKEAHPRCARRLCRRLWLLVPGCRQDRISRFHFEAHSLPRSG